MTKPTPEEKCEHKTMHCLGCSLPRAFYDLKQEPSFAFPDYSMPPNCQAGHCWIYDVPKKPSPFPEARCDCEVKYDGNDKNINITSSPEARVDWESIERLNAVDEATRKHLELTKPDTLMLWDKVNQLVDAVNKLSAAFEKGREAR